MSRRPLQFAYWVPNVSGGLVVSTLPQRTSHEFEHNVEIAQTAERVGFDYGLTQVRYLASYGADEQHESVSFSLGLLSKTERLNLIAAVHPGQWPPHVLAKLAATAQETTGGRFNINVVSGWLAQEYTDLGLPWLEHGERYRRAEEFIEVFRGLLEQDEYTFRGDFYRTRDVTFRPKPKVAPGIFQGGNSTAARQMGARLSDWYFMNGNSVDGVREQIDEVSGYAREYDRRPRFALNGFGVVRDSQAAAQQQVEDIIENADAEKVEGFRQAVQQAGASTRDGKGMWADSTLRDLVQYNDGFKTGLVGTPEQVAERIIEYKKVGLDLLLVGFLHVREEVEQFGEEVIPLVRELEDQLDSETDAA